jgi:ribosomal protein S2
MGIPVVAIVNTDTDPKTLDYPVPGNNRLSTSVRWILEHLEEVLKKTAPAPSVPPVPNTPANPSEK